MHPLHKKKKRWNTHPLHEAKKKANPNAQFTKNVFRKTCVKTSLHRWTAAHMYLEQRKEPVQCTMTMNA